VMALPVASDTFFADEPGLVAVFDFDYATMFDFQRSLSWAQLALCPCLWPCACMCCYPCFLEKNIEWSTRAQHVALTVDGIRYVKERRPQYCGFSCSDVGRESKTVPYDKITDCDVQEPAGAACCCCVQNVLSSVRVDTASSGVSSEGAARHELDLRGLKFANEFKKSVWSMKRGEAPANAVVPLVNGGAQTSSKLSAQLSAPRQVDMNTALLTEIRDELRQLNAAMVAKA